MAYPSTGTKLTDLFDPQVVGAMVEQKYVDKMVFSPLATIDRTLVGAPGSKITLPYYDFIGEAEVVAEAADIPIKKLVENTREKAIHKFGIGLQITDEAVLSAYTNPVNEAVNQIVTSIAAKMDNEVLDELGTISSDMTATGTFSADAVADALTLFGEDLDDGGRVILINPDNYATLRKANGWIPGTELGANTIIRGSVGMIHGCQVIVSNKLKSPKASYIVKPGALRIIAKRDTLVEVDRDIINKSTVITADKHAVAYLYDTSKAIKMVAS